MVLNAVRSLRQCNQYVFKLFTKNGVPEAKAATKYIVAHVLGRKTLHGINPRTKIDNRQWSLLKKLANRRITGEPLQYVLEEWDFCNLVLSLKPPVLIPRPETEELVSHILKDENTEDAQNFLEVGCGSGAICLSLLHQNRNLHAVAIDVSKEACELTYQNARKYGLDRKVTIINTCVSDVKNLLPKVTFDFIVSNPPYIDTKDMEDLPPEIKNFEDHQALHGGADGLDVVREILNLAPSVLDNKGSVWLEVDSKHPLILQKLKWKGLDYVKTVHDFRNMPRFSRFQKKSVVYQ